MLNAKTISATIADHVASVSAARLAPEVLHATRRALLDGIGVMLAASGLAEDARPYRAVATAPGPARLLGGGTSSPALAALANGALAHALDFGDTFDAGPAHPHAAAIPALLAIADAEPGMTVGDLLAVLACAGDLACRLSLAPARGYEDGGWYPPPLVNLPATAAAAAKLLGLDIDGIRAAMGLALLQGTAPGEIKYDAKSPLRGVREGFVARAAVDAALLARTGARAFADPLGGKAGFFAVYGGGPPDPALLDGLGERFLGTEVSFKPWPSCRGTHPYIEAALALRRQVSLADIVAIEAETGPIQAMLVGPPEKAAPRTPIEAKFSIPFTVAAAVVEGDVTLTSFAPDRLADPAILALAARVSGRRNPAWGRAEAASGALALTTRDGRHIEHRVMQAAGHPDRPLSDEALIAKFVACAGHAADRIAPSAAEQLADRIMTAPLDADARRLLDY